MHTLIVTHRYVRFPTPHKTLSNKSMGKKYPTSVINLPIPFCFSLHPSIDFLLSDSDIISLTFRRQTPSCLRTRAIHPYKAHQVHHLSQSKQLVWTSESTSTIEFHFVFLIAPSPAIIWFLTLRSTTTGMSNSRLLFFLHLQSTGIPWQTWTGFVVKILS